MNNNNVTNGGLPLEMWDHILSFASPDTLAQATQINKEIGAFAQERINNTYESLSTNKKNVINERKQRMSDFRSKLTDQENRWVSQAGYLQTSATNGWIGYVSSDASYDRRIKVSEKNILD